MNVQQLLDEVCAALNNNNKETNKKQTNKKQYKAILQMRHVQCRYANLGDVSADIYEGFDVFFGTKTLT